MTVHVENLTVEYTTAGYVTRPLDGLSFEAEQGQLVLLHGASGCGKTTLLSVLGAILKPASGSVVVSGTDVLSLSGRSLVEYRRRGVGIVFQSFNLVPSLSALENVEAPLRLAGVRGRACRTRATELLTSVGLAEYARRRPSELSGGQQQRVAIARGLVHNPPVLLADEPTAHLDFIQVEEVLRQLRSLADDGRIVIVATHDHRLRAVADASIELTPLTIDLTARVRRLKAGEILFRQGDPSDLVYLVSSGEIEVVREWARKEDTVLATKLPGEYIGELGPLLALPRSATARAGVAGAEVRGITAQAFRSRAASNGVSRSRPKRRQLTQR